MLAIRMQRTGRKGHAMFRVIVQDSRLTPTSGKIVASLGNYDPHARVMTVDKDKASFYLEHGAQPSDRIARLLKKEGVKLPKWVVVSEDLKRDIRNPDKRRSTRPAGPVVEKVEATEAELVVEEAPTEDVTVDAVTEADPAITETEVVAEEVVTEETPAEISAVEVAEEPTLEVATESPVEESVESAVEATPEVEEVPAEEATPKA